MSKKRKAEIIRRLRAADDPTDDGGLVAGEPIRQAARFLFFDVAKWAASLYEILDDHGIDPVRFGWDWRRPIDEPGMQARLRAEIERLHTSTGQGVVLIVHSTGGLIVRHLLENNHDLLPRVERVIAFGVPWAGLLKSLEAMNARSLFADLLINGSEAQEVIAHSWAAFDLLPPDPTTTDMRDADGNPLNLVVDAQKNQISPLVSRGWFPAAFRNSMALRADRSIGVLGQRTPTPDFGNVPVTNVVGWGADMVLRAELDSAGAAFNFPEGTDDVNLDDGDGTVPRRSAAWLRGPNVTTYHVPIGITRQISDDQHVTLWRNQGGRNLLAHLLAGAPLETFAYGAIDKDDFGAAGIINSSIVRVRLVALDAAGNLLPEARVRVRRLTAGAIIEDPFDPTLQGRKIIRVPRNRIQRTMDNRFRRLFIEISWREGNGRQRQRREFLIHA